MARTFKDETGREWSITIDVPQLRRVRKQTSFDGADILSRETFEKLGEPDLLVDVLYVLLQRQIDERQLTPEQFAMGLLGDSIERALDSLVLAFADFYPALQRTILESFLANKPSQRRARQSWNLFKDKKKKRRRAFNRTTEV